MHERFEPEKVLTVRNPILLWLFAHGWEEPGWGTTLSQIALASGIHELASKISDNSARERIQSIASSVIIDKASSLNGQSKAE